jgi:integrase
MARQFLRGRIWHAGYYVNGVERTQSLRTDNPTIAKRRLDAILKKTALGWAPQDDRLMFEGLIEKVRLDREVRQRRCKDLNQRAVHLRLFLGDMRAVDITTETVEQYVTSRLKGKAAHATINRELALLRRAFHLAELTRKPRIQLLPENNARQDFLDWADFQSVRQHLPESMRDVVTFMYLSSWRSGQVVAMEWRDIDMKNRVATARGETTKSGEPHRIALVGELWEIIERAGSARRSSVGKSIGAENPEGRGLKAPPPLAGPVRLPCPYVFHRDGEPFRLRGGKAPLRVAWNAACAAAGFAGHVLHCLRRSGVRNMINGGVDPMLAMQVSGHRTMAMLNRYRIVDLKDQERGLEKMMTYLAEQPSEGKVHAIK